jgi:hypothetical protein
MKLVSLPSRLEIADVMFFEHKPVVEYVSYTSGISSIS